MSVTLNASTSSGLVQTADTSGQIELQSNGTTKLSVLSTGVSGTLVQGTAVTASGSSVDFTSIPSWVKRITVSFSLVSMAAAGNFRLRIGSGSLSTSGYSGASTVFSGTPTTTITANTDSIALVATTSGTTQVSGQAVLTLIGSNTWVSTGSFVRTGDSLTLITQGTITLGGSLDLLSVVASTSTFDAGTINIQYEG